MASRILRCTKGCFPLTDKHVTHQLHHQMLSKAKISTTLCNNMANDGKEANASSLPWQRSSYKYFLPIQTRWSDNDQYGHVNNIIYYSYFDSVINHYLIHNCGLDTNVRTSKIIGYMVDTRCTFREPISFPEVALAGLAVSYIGRSSIQYSVAIFAEKSDRRTVQSAKPQELAVNKVYVDQATDFPHHQDTACAIGQCTHVFVDTSTSRPIKLPDVMKAALEKIQVDITRNNSKL